MINSKILWHFVIYKYKNYTIIIIIIIKLTICYELWIFINEYA